MMMEGNAWKSSRYTMQTKLKPSDETEQFLLSPSSHRRSKGTTGEMHSHDFEPEESIVWRKHERATLTKDGDNWWTSSKIRGFYRWVLTFLIGVATAIVAVVITYATSLLISLKFTACEEILVKFGPILSYPAFVLFNIFFVFCANYVVRVEPACSGAGVPEIKTYLNGVAIPRIVRAKTLLMKAVGVTFSVSGGLPTGKEGPMIQIGSGIAAGIAQGKSTTMGFDTSFSKFQDFRNDREKRDFVACGAAAGVAAAFGAPIAGVLFTLEESASFWSTKLTWRTFFCSLVTVYTLYLIRSASSGFGKMEHVFMFNFGEFNDIDHDMANYSVWELLIFTLIGVLGGFVGAATVHVSTWFTKRRKTQTDMSKAVEVHLICFVMATCAFFIPLMLGQCTDRPDPDDEDANYTAQEQILINELVQFRCDDGYYNELASLWFVSPETAIKQLFHYRSPESDISRDTFSSFTLIMFFIPYQLIFSVMIGSAVPGGVFIPSMIAGAAMGRLIGFMLRSINGAELIFADKGTYSLVGAAATLSGLTRLTIAATVMLLEATGSMQYVLPLMISVMSGRFVGNMFNLAIQDMQINVKKLPFLEVDLVKGGLGPAGVELTAAHVMSIKRPPITIHPICRVGELHRLLSENLKIVCFPIVDPNKGDILYGTILRKTLCTLFQHKHFIKTMPSDQTASSTPLSWPTLQKDYPRFSEILDPECAINETEAQLWVDLRPYINLGPYTILQNSSLGRTYRMFRSLGLRHLCVVDLNNHIVGMITRKDLTEEALEERAREVRLQAGGDTSDISTGSPTSSETGPFESDELTPLASTNSYGVI